MYVVISAVLLAAGLAMLCFGGNWLVSGGSAIAKRFRISNLVIGMTIVAYGTSTPELAASIAAAQEHSAIILGNIIGSNIANVGMVIGIAAIITPLVMQKSMLRKEIPIMLGVSGLLVAISVDGQLSIYDGVLLLAGLAVFAVYAFKNAASEKAQAPLGDAPRLKPVILVGIGIAFLYVGAILTVDNAVILAEEFGLSEKVIGLTVIAIGTSLPELVTSIIAIRRGHADIGIGNIIGSNIYNILMIIGIGAVLGGVAVPADVFIDYVIMILFSASILIAVKTGVIGRLMGACLAASYVAYLAVIFFK